MSLITYNGQTLRVVKTLDFTSRAVMSDDGADLLYTHHYLRVRCVINKQATTDGFAVGLGATVANLKKLMLTPRQTLTYSIGGSVALQSPPMIGGAQGTCDARNGPIPLSFNVVEIHGTKTAIADFEIETWIPPTFVGTTALISHRWGERIEIDNQFYATRTVNGTAVFRTDFLDQAGLTPDDFRVSLRHPIPLNMQRQLVNVDVSSDRCTVHYQLVDEENYLNLGAGNPFVKVEGRYTRRMEWQGNTLPMLHATLNVRLWGARYCSRSSIATGIATIAAIYAFDQKLTAMWENSEVSVDIVEPYGEGWFDITLGGATGNILMLATRGRQLQDMAAIPQDMGQVAQFAPRDNPRPPSSQGMRGTSIDRIITQALYLPGATPPAVPVDPAPKDVLVGGA